MNLINILENNYWFAAIVVSAIYISDYSLTLKASKLYQAGARKHIEIEGGIELNPQFRDDINKLKKINPKFIKFLIIMNLMLAGIFGLSKIRQATEPMEIVLGGWILTELFIHINHIRSNFLYKAALKSDGLAGQIKYSRRLAHNLTAIDALAFAVFYGILWLLVGRIFFASGAFTCLVIALSQRKWLKKNMAEMSSEKGRA